MLTRRLPGRGRSLAAAGLFAFLGLVAVWLPAARGADVSIKPGDQVVRVQIPHAAALAQFEAMDLDVWSHEYGVGPVEVHVSTAERQALTNAGWAFEVVVDNLPALFEAEQAVPRGPGYTSYQPLADIESHLAGLVAARPDLCSLQSIGLSIENRPIRAIRISGPSAGPKPGVLFHGLQHAREWITGPSILFFADHLVNQYDLDPCIRELVDRTEIYLIPCLNPDGYFHSWLNSNTRLWRKNRRVNSNGTIGVDLNRNWAFGWGGGGSSGTPGNETYRGPSAFSEPETQAVRDFMLAHPNIRAYLDVHSYSQLVMWPWGYVCTPVNEPDATVYANLGTAIRDEIFAVHGVNYVAGPVCSTIYQASGASVDWNYGTAGRFAYTYELRPATSNPGFLLPADQILPTCEEVLPTLIHLSQWASSGFQLQPAEALPSTVTTLVETPVALTATPIRESVVPDSGRLYYRLGTSGPFAWTAMASEVGSPISGTLPGIPCGATLQYYFTAQGDAGYLGTLPCGAPGAVYSVTAQEHGCPPQACPTLPGDMNADGKLTGLDIGGFAGAMTTPPNYAICADLVVPYGSLNSADVAEFVGRLLVVP